MKQESQKERALQSEDIRDAAILSDLASVLSRKQGLIRFRAEGRSMFPFIRHGDLVTVATGGNIRFRIGDMVLYRKGSNRLALHRIVARRTSGLNSVLRVRGDAMKGKPETIMPEDVLGLVVEAQTQGKNVRKQHAARRLIGLAWALAQSAGIPLAEIARRLWCDKERLPEI